MSPTIFLALCILGMDFMLYALFQWTYGDKRRSIARRVAAFKHASKDPSFLPFVVASQKAALGFQAKPKPAAQPDAKLNPRDPARRTSFRQRLA
jgi:hypothetical protein